MRLAEKNKRDRAFNSYMRPFIKLGLVEPKPVPALAEMEAAPFANAILEGNWQLADAELEGEGRLAVAHDRGLGGGAVERAVGGGRRRDRAPRVRVFRSVRTDRKTLSSLNSSGGLLYSV